MNTIRIIAIIAILMLGIYVALSPGLVYAPAPRIILYFLICFLPSLLLGVEASSRFQLKLPGFVFTTAGGCAICFGALVLLNHLSKAEEKIAVFQVFDEHNEPVFLDWKDALKIPPTPNGLTITKFIDGNNFIAVFPEQVGKAEVQIKKSPTGPLYVGDITYSGSRTSKLVLGKDLKANH
ncbi:hypothetical protein [Chitinophaga silvisoli]|uniref:Transmembrane protein n=1 Tax=Chitinophaga silvisoli TaxID=2291814 RepID=A0A3E1NW49_9BACT|nr:hypothetical protein [Chitinophaga silvisoli]RFM32171.1 hypothetical protein DXN04_25645 [Chitinophaga silvisoli]